MGAKEKTIKKIVLDTNVLVSALLFKGALSDIVDLWKTGRIIPVLSNETFAEFKTVLEYPKFSLTKQETKMLIEEQVLPYFDIVDITGEIKNICRDSDDDKFIACAVCASADFIVTGDADLLEIGKYKSIRIIPAAALMKMLK